MFSYLNQISRERTAWGLLMLSALAFELCALYFQHVMELLPCVMCIYERVAMMGVFFAGVIGISAPRIFAVRWLALILWGASTSWGLKLAIEHVQYQFPDPTELFGAMCDIFVRFPSWAPLNEWAPWMFEAYGDCSKIVWEFMGWSMPQWLVVIFIGILVVFLAVLISQFVNPSKNEKTEHTEH